MGDDQQFCLRWNNHQSTLIQNFDTLLESGTLVDCTLAAEGKYLKAHKVVLSACSPYFEGLLSEHYDKHPVFILKDVKFKELKAMMDYMYRGEVNISQDQLTALLKAAESLQIKGLSDNRTGGAGSATTGKADTRPAKTASSTAVASSSSVDIPHASSGLTIEKNSKVPRQSLQQVSVSDLPEDSASPQLRGLSSREGSQSPTRRRKRLRRRSLGNDDTNSMENHEASNSSDVNVSAPALAVAPVADEKAHADPADSIGRSALMQQLTKPADEMLQIPIEKPEPSEEMIQPKSEYMDDQESVEDLTNLDDDMNDLNEMEQDNSRAGPSHDPSQHPGIASWHIAGDRSNASVVGAAVGPPGTQDEVFLAAHEAAQAQRDSQVPMLKIEENSNSAQMEKTTSLMVCNVTSISLEEMNRLSGERIMTILPNAFARTRSGVEKPTRNSMEPVQSILVSNESDTHLIKRKRGRPPKLNSPKVKFSDVVVSKRPDSEVEIISKLQGINEDKNNEIKRKRGRPPKISVINFKDKASLNEKNSKRFHSYNKDFVKQEYGIISDEQFNQELPNAANIEQEQNNSIEAHSQEPTINLNTTSESQCTLHGFRTETPSKPNIEYRNKIDSESTSSIEPDSINLTSSNILINTIKRKRGRPAKIEKKIESISYNIEEKEIVPNELNNEKLSTSNIESEIKPDLQNTNTSQSSLDVNQSCKRKRGRPPKCDKNMHEQQITHNIEERETSEKKVINEELISSSNIETLPKSESQISHNLQSISPAKSEIKRKRGRPPKNYTIDTDEIKTIPLLDNSIIDSKSKASGSQLSSYPKISIIKRKRGRPPKYNKIDEDNDNISKDDEKKFDGIPRIKKVEIVNKIFKQAPGRPSKVFNDTLKFYNMRETMKKKRGRPPLYPMLIKKPQKMNTNSFNVVKSSKKIENSETDGVLREKSVLKLNDEKEESNFNLSDKEKNFKQSKKSEIQPLTIHKLELVHKTNQDESLVDSHCMDGNTCQIQASQIVDKIVDKSDQIDDENQEKIAQHSEDLTTDVILIDKSDSLIQQNQSESSFDSSCFNKSSQHNPTLKIADIFIDQLDTLVEKNQRDSGVNLSYYDKTCRYSEVSTIVASSTDRSESILGGNDDKPTFHSCCLDNNSQCTEAGKTEATLNEISNSLLALDQRDFSLESSYMDKSAQNSEASKNDVISVNKSQYIKNSEDNSILTDKSILAVSSQVQLKDMDEFCIQESSQHIEAFELGPTSVAQSDSDREQNDQESHVDSSHFEKSSENDKTSEIQPIVTEKSILDY